MLSLWSKGILKEICEILKGNHDIHMEIYKILKEIYDILKEISEILKQI